MSNVWVRIYCSEHGETWGKYGQFIGVQCAECLQDRELLISDPPPPFDRECIRCGKDEARRVNTYFCEACGEKYYDVIVKEG